MSCFSLVPFKQITLLFFWAIAFCGPGFFENANAGKWQVAILILGAGEDSEFQTDVDQNIKELARISGGNRISLLRDFQSHRAIYFPDRTSRELNAWDPLFFAPPVKGIQVPGALRIEKRSIGKSSLEEPEKLREFFNSAFPIGDWAGGGVSRLLMIYGHGFGPKGLKAMPLRKLRDSLTVSLGLQLDVLWLESCFMASAEVATELSSVARFLISSQDSEFTAGAPFDSLDILSEADSPEVAAEKLAEHYIESYSFTNKGEQRRSILKSSATLSVIELSRLKDSLGEIARLSARLARLNSGDKAEISRGLKKAEMEKTNLVDLGRLLLLAEDSKLKALFEVDASRSLKSTPRIELRPPNEDMLVVYGWNNWSMGHKSDIETHQKIVKNLKPEVFVLGPSTQEWPARSVHRRLYVNPFAPGMNQFSYYFYDPRARKVVSEVFQVERKMDFSVRRRGSKMNPVVLSAYTHSVGASAEKYTGLNVSHPFQSLPFVDYADLEFFRHTRWTQ